MSFGWVGIGEKESGGEWICKHSVGWAIRGREEGLGEWHIWEQFVTTEAL